MWDMKCPLPCSASFVTITLGAHVVVLGLIEGLADGLAGLARFTGGALADDASRRRTVALGGYSLTALLAALIGGAYAIWQVALLRMATWTARGLRVPARNALLADLVGDPCGSVCGPGTAGRRLALRRAAPL